MVASGGPQQGRVKEIVEGQDDGNETELHSHRKASMADGLVTVRRNTKQGAKAASGALWAVFTPGASGKGQGRQIRIFGSLA